MVQQTIEHTTRQKADSNRSSLVLYSVVRERELLTCIDNQYKSFLVFFHSLFTSFQPPNRYAITCT
jgi:hypothetical protein